MLIKLVNFFHIKYSIFLKKKFPKIILFVFQHECKAENEDGCEFKYSSLYLEDVSEEGLKKLKVYLHVYDGQKEKCPEVSNLHIYIWMKKYFAH